MGRVSLIVTLILLVSCGRESEQPAPATSEAPSASDVVRSNGRATDAGLSTSFFVGSWASEEANCDDAAWQITDEELQTPGEVTCRFQRVTPTARGADVEATCYAERPPEQWTLEFSYAQSARALLIENAPFNDIGLVRCDASADASTSNAGSAKGPQGAAAVVRNYYELLAAGRFEEASQFWTASERLNAMRSFEQDADQYEGYDVDIGEPGRIEGAAGSLYISVPVAIHATRKNGEDVQLRREVSLRRSNDVPGATPEQLSWRIVRVELRPARGRELGIGDSESEVPDGSSPPQG